MLQSLLLSFIIVNTFIGGGGRGGGHLSLTTNHGFVANSFSVPPTSTTSSISISKRHERRRTMRHSTTMLSLGKNNVLLGLRQQQQQQQHRHQHDEQSLLPKPQTQNICSPPSRSAVHFPPILIISFISLFAFQKQPALAIQFSNNITSSTAPILVTAATITAKTLSIASTPGTTSSYHLTRILFLRLLAIVYIAAFSIAKFQNVGLIGDRGILPARNVLNECDSRAREKSKRRNEWLLERKQYTTSTSSKRIGNFFVRWKNTFIGGPIDNFMHDKLWHRTDKIDRPLLSLLWLAPNRDKLNPWLANLANIGIILSFIMLCAGSANVFLLLGLWSIQRSFMAVGGEFYGYGWEMQLAELTFLAMFLVPMISMNPFFGPTVGGLGGVGSTSSIAYYPVPILVVWAMRWFLFKIMLGAGLIKLKSSDVKWKLGNMSAMDYFYETQPVPNPFSRYFHFNPKKWHRFEVYCNHFVELVAPFLLLMPFRKLRQVGGIIQIIFQLILISSGNLSFLNWLTIVPALCCFDDACLKNNLPPVAQKIIFIGTRATQSCIPDKLTSVRTPMLRNFASIAFFVLMAKLNIKVVRNLLARRQIMNGSFDKLRLCGTYGAFGVVSEQREELIIESASEVKGPWLEYQFKVKPGDVYRRPKWRSPYHHRLDWQMWIASQSGPAERSQWLMNLLLKLLQQEKDVNDLIECDPWKLVSCNSPPDRVGGSPKYIRIEKYLYKFYNHQNDGGVGSGKPPYWVRQRVGRFFPKQGVMTAEMLQELVKRR